MENRERERPFHREHNFFGLNSKSIFVFLVARSCSRLHTQAVALVYVLRLSWHEFDSWKKNFFFLRFIVQFHCWLFHWVCCKITTHVGWLLIDILRRDESMADDIWVYLLYCLFVELLQLLCSLLRQQQKIMQINFLVDLRLGWFTNKSFETFQLDCLGS